MYNGNTLMLFLWVSLLMGNVMVKESWDIKMDANMKEIGKMIWEMVKDLRDTQMVTHIMDILRWEKLMEKECILGVMGKFMTVNGIKDSNMDMEYGEECLMILILENGDLQKRRVMVSIPGKMAIDMKESGNTV